MTTMQAALARSRARAEAAEAMLAEESQKVAALEQLVELLQFESESLQRKWEARRDHPITSCAAPAPPAQLLPHALPQVLPQVLTSDGEVTCVGVLLVRLRALEPLVAATVNEEAALFVELSLDGGLARSHSLTSHDSCRQWEQAFALPVRQLSSALELHATLCDGDGDGGGRPMAQGVMDERLSSLPPFVSRSSAIAMRAPDSTLAYRSAAPTSDNHAPEAQSRRRNSSSSSGGGGGGGGGSLAVLSLTVEWRPFAGGEAESGCDALGFPLGLGGAGGSERHGRAANSEVDGGSGPRAAKILAAQLAAQLAARRAGGGWWEVDATQLSAWNAAVCSVSSLAHLHPRRLRRCASRRTRALASGQIRVLASAYDLALPPLRCSLTSVCSWCHPRVFSAQPDGRWGAVPAPSARVGALLRSRGAALCLPWRGVGKGGEGGDRSDGGDGGDGGGGGGGSGGRGGSGGSGGCGRCRRGDGGCRGCHGRSRGRAFGAS